MRHARSAITERAAMAVLCVAAALGLTAHGAEQGGPDTIRFPHSTERSAPAESVPAPDGRDIERATGENGDRAGTGT
ncbi:MULTISPECIES: hypothetical protein [Streptomyces]|uniref:Uncharacterized protein n=1 Tax=Streptomyces lycii TaxID=2654337 RepID=A0ABQ7FLE8_9ACTN|nr:MULTISPECIES: hypothetical protein [Streptomyces]KAF4409781.1 hypothetical protein GCU69_07205 [Streptomyces lycii]PGH49990.1 hypothetical protein CRI70_14515 [Streptomyces sp. Ru87]